MLATYSEIKRQQADVQLRRLKGETLSSETASEFTGDRKRHSVEIQCIIYTVGANQWGFCVHAEISQD